MEAPVAAPGPPGCSYLDYGASPLTVGALAEGNLRLGATSDVYAAALAASRGLQPGTEAYNRLVQQIEAQDRLRELQGKNPSFADQAARDKLVQWFANMQQQQASQRAASSHEQEIAYWSAIAAGLPAPGPAILIPSCMRHRCLRRRTRTSLSGR